MSRDLQEYLLAAKVVGKDYKELLKLPTGEFFMIYEAAIKLKEQIEKTNKQ